MVSSCDLICGGITKNVPAINQHLLFHMRPEVDNHSIQSRADIFIHWIGPAIRQIKCVQDFSNSPIICGRGRNIYQIYVFDCVENLPKALTIY